MKKRLLSLATALVMLLSLMPSAAIAADGDVEQVDITSTQTLYAYWYGGSQGDPIEGNSEGRWIGDWGDDWCVLFYTDQAGTNPVPDTVEITFVPDSDTAADAVAVTNNDDGSWNVAYDGLGSGVLQTTVNGVVYERAVLSRLPHYGFFKGTSITADSYLPYDSTFIYSDTNDTFYYVVDANIGIKVTGVSRAGSLDWSIDSAGNLVTFTVPAGVDADGEYNIQFSVQNTNTAETWNWYAGINLASAGRRVVAQSDYRDYDAFYETEDDTYDTSASLNPSYETGRVFYIRDNGVVTLAENYSISSSDPSVMTVEELGTAANTGHTIWNILAHDFGSANVVLTFDSGEVLTYPVRVVLPNMGFSTADTLTEATYISDREFCYTENSRTFYYVINWDGLTVSSVTLTGDLANGLSYTINDDKNVVTFEVEQGVTADLDGNIFFVIADSSGTGNHGYSFDVLNGAPMLVYHDVYGNWDDLQEDQDDRFYADMALNPNYSHWASFHLRSGGSADALLDITSVVSGDTNVAEVEYLGISDLGNPVYEIFGRDFGNTTITVTYGSGETLTMPVSVVLPSRGFSTADTLAEATYLSDQAFYYTENSRTFYYIVNQDDLTISGVTLEGDLANGLDYAVSSDGRVVTFTVKQEVTADLDGDIFFALKNDWNTWNNGYSFDVLNGAPMLVYHDVYGNWDNLQEDEDDRFYADMALNPNNSHWVSFHLRSDGSADALLDITSVVSGDTNVAEVEYLGISNLGNPVYRILGRDFGDTTITVTYGSGETLTMPVSVVLPSRGFSTADTLTEATYISDWAFYYTENSRTFYYVLDEDGRTISDVTLEGDLASVLSYTVNDDQNVVTFTVEQGVTADLDGDIFITMQRQSGSTSRSGWSFDVLNGAPRMVYRWANGNRDDLWEDPNDNTRSYVTLSPTYTHWVVFCVRSDGAVTALQDITSVVSSDLNVAVVSYMGQTDLGNPAFEIHGIGFGDATITVTYNGGKTLTMPVSVVLPDRGWSSAPTMTQQSFVAEEFTYTVAAPTLYYVTNDCTLTSFQLASNYSQYADCFDIQLVTNSSGSYAAITVKPGAALPGDRWIRFEVEYTQSNGGNWSSSSSIRFTNGDAPKLGTPSDLEWNVEYDWNNNKSTRMGSVSFKRATSDQARYEIEYYRVGESVTVAEGSWGWGSTNTAEYFSINTFIYDNLPSGDYYFRIRARGDGYNYRSGDWVTSDTWTYTAPQAQLTTPTGLSWNDTDENIIANWTAVTGAKYYEVNAYYAETQNGEKVSLGSNWDITGTSWWLWNDVLAEYGDGWYFFRVRAISDDITQALNSEWSAYSYGYCLGDVIASVNSALDHIDVSSSAVDAVQQAVSNISKLDEALAADTDNSSTAAAIAKLEEELEDQYGITTGVTVDQAFVDDFAAADVQITGAALNIDTTNTTNTTAQLTISAVDSNNAPPALIETQYKNSIQFAMDIPEAKDTDASTPGLQLAVPVKITLPIPGNINPAFLAVLHCKEDANGNKTWEELSWPHVYQDEDGKWFATFVVDSMSPFALVERQSTATVEGGKIMLDAYLPTTGGDVEFLCAVYSSQGQMLKLVTLTSHNSDPVAIEVGEISEGIELKLISVNVGDGWIPVADMQDVPVTLQIS